ncbi:anaphase-promoting complex, subunit 10 [Calocera cornea HHB12733]|uniref:Anaphase-promoting complex subunit 10 n=1 Tax=Calocera cornea HHB12733 TaxID=1353952 RepID=A0A165GCQ0_9BASI|nr:anaphase-promoting complex, subunit 10 [Calocera cornea HHB12733]
MATPALRRAQHAAMQSNNAIGVLISPDSPKDKYQSLGHLASWSVSSAKYGFGVECLYDDDPSTFWQSDGPQPHFISLHFPRRVKVQKISMYLDAGLDESYTPNKLCIRAGTTVHDLQDVRMVSFEKPIGWVTFDVLLEADQPDAAHALDLHVLQIVIIGNYLSGKDTHVRGMLVLGPQVVEEEEEHLFPFTSAAFKMHQTIR